MLICFKDMRPKLVTLSVLFALTLGCPPGGVAHSDLDQQIAGLTGRIEREPGSAVLYFRRGELHRAHRDWPAALADYDRAARLDPGLAAVDLARATVAIETGAPQTALAAVERFLARQPDHAEGRALRARVLAALGRPLEAAEDWRRAIAASNSPRPDLYLDRARALASDERKMDEAVATLDEGLRRLGSVVTLDLAAMDLELHQRRYEAALARLDRLAAASPRKELWLVRRGEILEHAGRLAEARAAYAAALRAMAILPEPRRQTRAIEDLEARARTALNRLGERQ